MNYTADSPAWVAKRMISASAGISECLAGIDDLCDELLESKNPILEVKNWDCVDAIKDAVTSLILIEKEIKDKKNDILQKMETNVSNAKALDDRHWNELGIYHGVYYGDDYNKLRSDYPDAADVQQYINERTKARWQYYKYDSKGTMMMDRI